MAIQGAVNSSSAATLTLSSADSIYTYTGSGAATWTLPAVSGNSGEIFILYNRSLGSGTVTVTAAGSDLLYLGGNTAASFPVAPGGAVQLVNDGTYWLVLSGGGTLAPLYDKSAKSSEVSVSSGTAFTWSHTVGAVNAYGVVAVLCTGGSPPVPGTATAVVTFGSVTLSSVGWFAGNGGRFVWFFAAANIPTGTQTVSVKLTQSGKTFAGLAVSFTYANARYANPIVAHLDNDAYESPQAVMIPRNTVNPGAVVIGAAGAWPYVGEQPGLMRQSYNGSFNYFASELGTNGPPPPELHWYITGSYPVACSGTLAGIELLAAEPTTPHLKDTPYASGSVSSFAYTATAGTYLLVFINVGSFGNNPGTVTYDGVAMTRLAAVTSGARFYLYGMPNIAGGTKTIAGIGSTNAAIALSYASVTSVGTAATVSGVTTQSVTCSANQLIVQGFGTTDAGGMTPPPGGVGFIATASDTSNGSLGAGQCPGSTTFVSGNASTTQAGIAVVLS